MAKYYVYPNTFDEVARLYNCIKPVIKRDVANRSLNIFKDMRPTNDRRRQYERVIKVTDNKYLLCDYDSSWMPYCLKRGINDYDYADYLKIMEAQAAIVWERHKNGTESMTVRNISNYGVYSSLPTGRIDFLERHLPQGFNAFCDNGNQYVRVSGNRFVLPRNTFMPKIALSSGFNDLYKNRIDSYSKHMQSNHNQRITFKRVDGKWQAPERVYGERKWRIDTKGKSKLKPMLKEFYDNALPMIAMLAQSGMRVRDDDATRHEVQQLINYLARDSCVTGYSGAGILLNHEWATLRVLDKNESKVLKQVMADPQHEHYVALLKVLANNITMTNKQCARTYVNSWVNRVFGLINKVEVK